MHNLQRPTHTASRIVSVFMLVFAFAVTANAYTVVMRGGRRIEIPSQFVVTAATLTYETSPGIQITLNVAAIDIPATEKANNEPEGSLMKRAQTGLSEPSRGPAAPGTQGLRAAPARRTITNRDLESTAQRRRDSEVAYENRRRELGLPSVEESRRQAAAEAELIARDLAETRAAEMQSESYWRARASALRNEMAAMDAEIAWTRVRLEEGGSVFNDWSNGWSSGSFTTVVGTSPFGHRRFGGGGDFGGRGGFPGAHAARPSVFVAPRGSAPLIGRVGFGGGGSRGGVLVNPGFGRGGSFGNAGGVSAFPVFGSIGAYDYSYERGALITRFNELAGARAGLNARWRELEEEARRAGVAPGWLRP